MANPHKQIILIVDDVPSNKDILSVMARPSERDVLVCVNNPEI
ncbi:MAG TPA: hypothetical protein VN642_17735 [Dongiaceae bacterium]|nr:hypothetical protein [Dongiaceae bacterium]